MIDAAVLEQALEDRVADLTRQLEAKVRENLSGGLLEQQSGRLLASIVSSVSDDTGNLEGTVESQGVPYAAIQEYGGKTAAHEIIAVRRKALVFAGTGGQRFAKLVHHPGSVIPAHGYLGDALADRQDAIAADLKASVLAALTQD
jgi:phage gpG-like protein